MECHGLRPMWYTKDGAQRNRPRRWDAAPPQTVCLGRRRTALDEAYRRTRPRLTDTSAGAGLVVCIECLPPPITSGASPAYRIGANHRYRT